jgi:hemoglobin
MTDETTEIYPAVGSDQPFYDLVEAFYQGVETDPILRPLYPDELTASKLHFAWFLIQRFGGPTHYGENRGHPRLRMRHVPFQIGLAESQAWLRHMDAALLATPIFAPFQMAMGRYFAESAAFLINHSEVPSVSDSLSSE